MITKVARKSTDAATKESVRGDPQPYAWPRFSTRSRAARPDVQVSEPAKSNWWLSLEVESSGMKRWLSAKASKPTGTLMKKITLQPNNPVSQIGRASCRERV